MTRLQGSLVLLSLAFTVHSAAAQDIQGQVIEVIEGDTLIVNDGLRDYKVRAVEIDAPEMAQPYGPLALWPRDTLNPSAFDVKRPLRCFCRKKTVSIWDASSAMGSR